MATKKVKDAVVASEDIVSNSAEEFYGYFAEDYKWEKRVQLQ
jgi:hypothetical protein